MNKKTRWMLDIAIVMIMLVLTLSLCGFKGETSFCGSMVDFDYTVTSSNCSVDEGTSDTDNDTIVFEASLDADASATLAITAIMTPQSGVDLEFESIYIELADTIEGVTLSNTTSSTTTGTCDLTIGTAVPANTSIGVRVCGQDSGGSSGSFPKSITILVRRHIHSYTEQVVDDKYLKSAAKCTSAAMYYKSCLCGKASDTETFGYGDPAPHTSSDWIIDTDPQIGIAGSKHKECTECFKVLATESIPALICDHASTEVRNAKEATCTEDGYTGDLYCLVCLEKIEDGDVIKAAGHTFANGKCAVCGITETNTTTTKAGTTTTKASTTTTKAGTTTKPETTTTTNSNSKAPLTNNQNGVILLAGLLTLGFVLGLTLALKSKKESV